MISSGASFATIRRSLRELFAESEEWSTGQWVPLLLMRGLEPAPGSCSAPNAPGWWVFDFEHPRLTRLLGNVATRRKRHSKERQKSTQLVRSFFRSGHRGYPRSNFAVFDIFSTKRHNLGTRRATAPLKSAFESSLNGLSLTRTQI